MNLKIGHKGFTLIEILIVVAIIAILSSVVLVGLGPTQRAGRDARRVSDLKQTQTGLELYYNKCGYYPGDAEASNPCSATPADANTWSSMTTALTGSNIGVKNVPQDPTSGHTYYYGTNVITGATTGVSSYVIAATLEDVNNPAFSNYTVIALTGYTFADSGAPTSCAAPTYCVTL